MAFVYFLSLVSCVSFPSLNGLPFWEECFNSKEIGNIREAWGLKGYIDKWSSILTENGDFGGSWKTCFPGGENM